MVLRLSWYAFPPLNSMTKPNLFCALVGMPFPAVVVCSSVSDTHNALRRAMYLGISITPAALCLCWYAFSCGVRFCALVGMHFLPL